MNYNNGLNTEVKEKNEPKQRELNKIGKLVLGFIVVRIFNKN